MRNYLLFSVAILLIFASCKRKVGCTDPAASNYDFDSQKDCGCCEYIDPSTPYGSISANFNLKYRGSDYKLHDTVVDGNNVLFFSMFDCFISNVYLKSETNSISDVSKVALIKFKNGDKTRSLFLDSIPLGSYKEIGFGVGVDTVLNKIDPSGFPFGHPLSDQNYYWPGNRYVFIKLEGKADTISFVKSNMGLAYHTGTNALYRPVVFVNQEIDIQENISTTIDFNINIEQIFYGNDTIDYMNNPTVHTTSVDFPFAEKFSNNFSKAITIP